MCMCMCVLYVNHLQVMILHTSYESKKVGTMWKALSEDEQKVYYDQYDKIVAQYNVNNDFWEAEAEEWGKGKVLKLKKVEGEW